jgi:phytoene dehydrogenase-like protein
VKQEVLRRYLFGLNRYLAEPIEDCLALDADGRLCLETKSPLDLETELKLPGGNIFHTAVSWPFAEAGSEHAGTWGVETGIANVFYCGSGAQRGGGVSGVPGHNAAMQVLEFVKGR